MAGLSWLRHFSVILERQRTRRNEVQPSKRVCRTASKGLLEVRIKERVREVRSYTLGGAQRSRAKRSLRGAQLRRIYAERGDTKDSGDHLFEPASSLLK
jgi:hypothetical protein